MTVSAGERIAFAYFSVVAGLAKAQTALRLRSPSRASASGGVAGGFEHGAIRADNRTICGASATAARWNS